MIIAVDGPSAAGKGTVSRAIAKHLGYHFLDTGSLYRMVGLAMLNAGKSAVDEVSAATFAKALDTASIAQEVLRNEKVATMASQVAAIPGVRQALLEYQRAFARRKPGAVLDGRDIGTVVCPGADLKLFVTASSEVRARRRFEELKSLGQKVDFKSVLEEVMARDERDTGRSLAPAHPAADAIVIDTSELTREEVLAVVMDLLAERQKL